MDHSQLVGQSRSILGLMHAYRSLPELSKPARIKKPDLNVVVRSWAVSVEASKPNAAADFVVPKAHAFWSLLRSNTNNPRQFMEFPPHSWMHITFLRDSHSGHLATPTMDRST